MPGPSLAIERERLGFLLVAAMNLSEDGYVLCRYSARHQQWRVNVRRHGAEHVATSHDSPLLAMDRALEWLQSQ